MTCGRPSSSCSNGSRSCRPRPTGGPRRPRRGLQAVDPRRRCRRHPGGRRRLGQGEPATSRRRPPSTSTRRTLDGREPPGCATGSLRPGTVANRQTRWRRSRRRQARRRGRAQRRRPAPRRAGCRRAPAKAEADRRNGSRQGARRPLEPDLERSRSWKSASPWPRPPRPSTRTPRRPNATASARWCPGPPERDGSPAGCAYRRGAGLRAPGPGRLAAARGPGRARGPRARRARRARRAPRPRSPGGRAGRGVRAERLAARWSLTAAARDAAEAQRHARERDWPTSARGQAARRRAAAAHRRGPPRRGRPRRAAPADRAAAR